MTGLINLTEYTNPVAQTVRVTEPGGVVLTAASLYFYSAPTVDDPQISITFELRPIVEGRPSSNRFIPGTRVVKTAAEVRAIASTTWDQSSTLPEMKFEFSEPVFIPQESSVALVVYTNASAGQYQIWHAKMGEYKWINGVVSTAARVNSQPAVGVVYQSSNGTDWTPEQNLDLAFKLYKAKFNYQNSYATFYADVPPLKSLSDNGNFDGPLIFTSGSNQLKVIHPNHGYLTGDTVTLSYDDNASNSTVTPASTTAGVFGSSILGDRTITAVDPYGYTITMDSSADSSIRGGGNGLLATQQYRFAEFQLSAPGGTPEGTTKYYVGDFTQFADIMDSAADLTSLTPYNENVNMAIVNGRMHMYKHPFVLTDSNQEQSQLSGDPSMEIRIGMETLNQNVAPFINSRHVTAYVGSAFIDNQDSDAAPFTLGKNKLSTIPYVPETHPYLGTATAKHVTIPFNLSSKNPATSIRVLLDAKRPLQTDFDVLYRTCNRDNVDISTVSWTYFSKTPEGPNISNYNDTTRGPEIKEYEFSVFDLPVFDTYQIKVVFRSENSAKIPMIGNLRTIATI